MKHLYLIVTLLISTIFTLSAQGRDKDPFSGKKKNSGPFCEYMNMKRVYLMKEIDLSPADSADFFKQYDELQLQIMNQHKRLRKEILEFQKKNCNPSSSECLRFAEKLNNAPVEEAQLKKEYFERFKKILTPCQLLKLEIAETRFNRYLLNKRGPRHHSNKGSSVKK